MRPMVLAVILTLAACAGAPEAAPAGPPPPVSQAPTIDLPPPDAPDSCGAKDLQWLVGKPKSAIPVPTDPSRRRVVCTSCPVTLDYSPWRLNILFDAETGIVKEVKCG